MRRSILIVTIGLLILVATGLWFLNVPPPAAVSTLAVEAADASGFRRADGPKPFRFPQDHGPHPDFQTEWWYYTGNLETSTGRQFGYQFTVFRRALMPSAFRVERASDWATDQAYMAHFAVTDVAGTGFHSFERFARGAAGLAGAQATPYRVWLEDWSVEGTSEPDTYAMQVRNGEVALDLTLISRKEPVLQGEQGYSRKGPEPGNASYYYSLTRLETGGTITVEGMTYQVSGWSWMDHEYSTTALSEGQIGWDWFSLPLDNGVDVMLYHIRRDDGSIDRLSEGTLTSKAGDTTPLRYAEGEYSIEVTDTWKSPRSGAVYPSEWKVTIPSEGITLEIVPLLADQELDVSFIYWEGAVRITGEANGKPVSGFGYVEMTGYAGSFEGRF